MIDHLRDQYRASEQHACRVLLMVRGTYRYQSHQEPWTDLRVRIREIAQSRVRYGYRYLPSSHSGDRQASYCSIRFSQFGKNTS
jgi:hypothetical protein